jgi:3-deoxy-D-manno-octulosonic-acid transferase
MLVLYNTLQAVILPVFSPLLLLFVLLHPKYRNRVPSRLGFGLRKRVLAQKNYDFSTTKTYWIHALSIGEVTSAVPLIQGLKTKEPDCRIVFSVTTRSGRQVADNLLPNLVDHIINGPFDILPVVRYFMQQIKPSCFILVETDFWPNILRQLKKHNIPAVLVNGRVSDEALSGYKKMTFFFQPLFNSFSALCMQTEVDREKLLSLGVPPERLYTLGNLKFDTINPLKNGKGEAACMIKKQFPAQAIVFIAGSTHPGEEDILIKSYLEVRKSEEDFYLVIAPRDIRRAAEIAALADSYGLTASMRSESEKSTTDIFILDTIGELSACYGLGDISFVGGSLVRQGGHNPIEPAIMQTPVLFGPHMEDFSEIAQSLIEAGGAHLVKNYQEMSTILLKLAVNEKLRTSQGRIAQQIVARKRGVIERHLQLIHGLL